MISGETGQGFLIDSPGPQTVSQPQGLAASSSGAKDKTDLGRVEEGELRKRKGSLALCSKGGRTGAIYVHVLRLCMLCFCMHFCMLVPCL